MVGGEWRGREGRTKEEEKREGRGKGGKGKGGKKRKVGGIAPWLLGIYVPGCGISHTTTKHSQKKSVQ